MGAALPNGGVIARSEIFFNYFTNKFGTTIADKQFAQHTFIIVSIGFTVQALQKDVIPSYYSFISHGRTRQSNSFNLKTPLCRTSTCKASYFNRITKLWNFGCSLKSSSSFSSPKSFKQFVHKPI